MVRENAENRFESLGKFYFTLCIDATMFKSIHRSLSLLNVIFPTFTVRMQFPVFDHRTPLSKWSLANIAHPWLKVKKKCILVDGAMHSIDKSLTICPK